MYFTALPYSGIIWRRSDGQPLPRTAFQSQGTLVINNVQESYAGDYVCTITTNGGITGTSIATLIVIRTPGPVSCPRGYDNPPSCDQCAAGFVRDSFRRCVEDRGMIWSCGSLMQFVLPTEGQKLFQKTYTLYYAISNVLILERKLWGLNF